MSASARPRSRPRVSRRWLLPVLCLWLASAAGCIEGDQTPIRVTAVKFTGVKAVKLSEIRSVLATVQSSKLPWGTKHYFTRQDFDADLKRIVAFYNDRGYPDAKVRSFDVKLNTTQDAVAITLNVEEGRPVLVEQIEYTGFDVIPARRLAVFKSRLPLQPNAPLDRALAQAAREDALDEIKDHGYPYATVRLTERAGSNDHAKIVTLATTPGTLARYGAITVVGNTSVGDAIVKRQLLFRPGARYRLSQVQESQRRLYDLGTFQFAHVEPEIQEGQEPETVPITVTLTEGKPRKVNFGVGYGSEEKARATVDWTHVNFFGGARTMQISTKYSSLSSGVRANFHQPYLFSPHYDMLLSAQSWHDSEPAYTLNTNGGRISVERTLAQPGPSAQRRGSTALSMTFTDEYQNYRVSQEALDTPSFRPFLIALGLDPRTGQGHGLLSSLAFDLRRSTADNVLNARRGYLASAHVEQAGKALGGDFSYLETVLEGRYYQPIGKIAVVAARVRGGAIDAQGGQDVPFFKRYFIGGASSLRGWGRFEVSPLEAGLPVGGHTVLESSAEVRVPIWGNLTGVLFADGGNVWESAWDFNLGNLRYDIGPGLRYLTPIGPIRADLGYQLNPIEGLLVNGSPQPRRFRFHFSIGQAF